MNLISPELQVTAGHVPLGFDPARIGAEDARVMVIRNSLMAE